MDLLERRNKLLNSLARFSDPTLESHNFTSQEQLILGNAFLMVPAGLFWGMMCFAIGEVQAGLIPFLYGIISGSMLLVFLRKRNITFFISTHHSMLLLLPFLLQISLGGFVNSSAVILWSFIPPLSAMVINEQRVAIRWFIGFLGIILIGGIIDPFINGAISLCTDDHIDLVCNEPHRRDGNLICPAPILRRPKG